MSDPVASSSDGFELVPTSTQVYTAFMIQLSTVLQYNILFFSISTHASVCTKILLLHRRFDACAAAEDRTTQRNNLQGRLWILNLFEFLKWG